MNGKVAIKPKVETVDAEWLEGLHLVRSVVKWEISKQHSHAKAVVAQILDLSAVEQMV